MKSSITLGLARALRLMGLADDRVPEHDKGDLLHTQSGRFLIVLETHVDRPMLEYTVLSDGTVYERVTESALRAFTQLV